MEQYRNTIAFGATWTPLLISLWSAPWPLVLATALWGVFLYLARLEAQHDE